MTLNYADIDALLATHNGLLGGGRPLLEADPLLAPWVHPLEDMQERLRTWSRHAVADVIAMPPLGPLDQRGEAAVRALRSTIQARIQWHLSRDEAAEAAALERLLAHLFAEGLSFLKRPVPVQVAAARRLLELARKPEAQALLSTLSLGDATAADLLLQIEATHDALQAAFDARSDSAPEPSSELRPLRREAISLLADLRRLIERRSQEPARAKLLAAFG